MTPQPHRTNFKRLWCRCGVSVMCGCCVGVVRAGLGEGCHLWASKSHLTTTTPHRHHNRLKLVLCGCGVGVV